MPNSGSAVRHPHSSTQDYIVVDRHKLSYLFLLDCGDVRNEGSDPRPDVCVRRIQRVEDWSPDRHLDGSVRGDGRAAAKDGLDRRLREYTLITAGEDGEIRWRYFQRPPGRAVALAVTAVTGRTIVSIKIRAIHRFDDRRRRNGARLLPGTGIRRQSDEQRDADGRMCNHLHDSSIIGNRRRP